LTVILDHLGLAQPPSDSRDLPPFRRLSELLEVARYPNVAVKLCGAAALSEAPYPFDDLWPSLHRIVDAFTPQRLMWGSDISRFMGRVGFVVRRVRGAEGEYPGRHTYAEALFHLRETGELSADDKACILGRTAQTLLRWD
jgi:hypothetical protein